MSSDPDIDHAAVPQGEAVHSESDEEEEGNFGATLNVSVDEADSDDGDIGNEFSQDVQAAVVVDDVDEDSEHHGNNDGVRSEESIVEAVPVIADEDFDEDDDKPLNSLKTSKKKTQKKSDSLSKKKDSLSNKKRKYRRDRGKDLQLSNTARALLRETVPTLPVQIGDNIVVRSFGQLNVADPLDFSTPSALYPVGFSCDRYEYSPVHGRVIKLRFTILDGNRTEFNLNGPIFRVMWGQGVNEDVDQVEYPYDPEINSTMLQGEEPLANTASSDMSSEIVLPVAGMKVRVRFENDQYYYGTIESVNEKSEEKNKKKRKRVFEIAIQYDDSSIEEAIFPDPDISIVMPGYDDEMDHNNVDLEEFNGKPVHTAIGKSPLEAWSQVLQKLGLVDEFIVENGLSTIDAAKKHHKQSIALELKDNNDFNDEEERNSAALDSSNSNGKGDESSASNLDEPELEPESFEEKQLKEHVARLKESFVKQKKEDDDAAMNLATARISLLGTLACNPFADFEGSTSHQESWIATAVRKEKAKMGSTGNKRKIVTAADIVQRNNSFFNPDIEALIEGLPGIERFVAYERLESRSGLSAISKSFIQEQRMLKMENKKRSSSKEKSQKSKSSQDKERELKRKKREDERDARKRQKMEEEEEKKKARSEERLVRLRVQVEERMFKEASFQREKVVLAMAKNFGKEMARRRKAAELVATQNIDDLRSPIVRMDSEPKDLPPLSKSFDEDVLRIRDFVTTFGSFFIERGYVEELPTLDGLQSSVDTLRGLDTGQNRTEAISFVTSLAVALCKPLSAGLTRMLFASLIALNPTLQKDFGAAFFNEQSVAEVKDASQDSPQLQVLLPVNVLTWKEIARISFLSDALGELGHNRQEQAHYLRGYRSAGHPNSKEARRLRRVEDFAIALLRQSIVAKQEFQVPDEDILGDHRLMIEIPSAPSCNQSSWLFQLHNVLSLKNGVGRSAYVKFLKNSLDLLKALSVNTPSSTACMCDIEKTLLAVTQDSSENGSFDSAKITIAVSGILEKYSGFASESPNSTSIAGGRFNSLQNEKWMVRSDQELRGCQKFARSKMGELQSLELTPQGMKDLARVREKYMSDALALKEQMKRQESKEAGDEDDEDDEEEDEDDIGRKEENIVAAEIVSEKTKESCMVENGKKSSEANATSPMGAKSGSTDPYVMQKIGKETSHDDFCGDIPHAPELIRRCLAVLRTLCQSGPAEPFIFPVDPQTNPGYYDMLLKPMCMREVGLRLQKAARDFQSSAREKSFQYEEQVVADFARNIRLIGRNCLSYANAGPTVISAGGEMLRIFERLLLDWVLAPPEHLTPLHRLDDDICVDPHPSDAEATVLLCDGCEGNFNVSRLEPPLLDIPKGDWYCPRCVSGRWWGDLDPRIGKTLKFSKGESCKIKGCFFSHFENSTSSLMYEAESEIGRRKVFSLDEVNAALSKAGDSVPRIQCLEAVAESLGYGDGIDHGLRHALVPVLLNPNISDGAAQVALSSSVFRDSIAAAGTLLIADDREMTATEWLRLLLLLTMKCASSDTMQNLASDMENKAAERMGKRLESLNQIDGIVQVFAEVDDKGKTEGIDVAQTGKVKSDLEDSVSKGEARETNGSSSDTKAGSDTITIEANAVEVLLDSTDADTSSSTAQIAGVEMNNTIEIEDPKERRSTIIMEKSQRQKSREDCIAAYCIKKQLRSTFASFGEDTISEVIESTLVPEDPGLSLSSVRCKGIVCDFCGLPDTALGTNLVRVPNEQEWHDRILHASRSRRSFLIADLGSNSKNSTENEPKTQKSHLVALTLRIGEEIVADDGDSTFHEEIVDGGMLDFLPRNRDGFQEELSFSYKANFPFVTGSMSAHECCAIAAHNARKLMVVAKYKEREAALAEREAAVSCGRTLEIGSDTAGRSYWKFNADPESLYVNQNDALASDKNKSSRWERYAEPESIASVVVCLEKDPVVNDLKRAFPKARHLCENGKWSELLLNRHFKVNQRLQNTHNDANDEDVGVESYDDGDEVLVESDCGKILWSAKVIGVSKSQENDKVLGYWVSYSGWGSRYNEFVVPSRVLESTENNLRVQEERFDEVVSSHDGFPPELQDLRAREFLQAKDRVRGSMPLLDFSKLSIISPHSSTDDRVFSVAKTALLAIEMALPLGSVNTNSAWKPEYAQRWRTAVQYARGPWDLVRCTMLLEDIISEDWSIPEIVHLRSCLPGRWKALSEASPSSVAMRVILLDRSILYGNVDKKRYRLPKSRR